MDHEFVRVESRGPSGAVALLTLDRPEKANAYTVAMLAQLEGALSALSRDDAVGPSPDGALAAAGG